jgi:hypothetical protein
MYVLKDLNNTVNVFILETLESAFAYARLLQVVGTCKEYEISKRENGVLTVVFTNGEEDEV